MAGSDGRLVLLDCESSCLADDACTLLLLLLLSPLLLLLRFRLLAWTPFSPPPDSSSSTAGSPAGSFSRPFSFASTNASLIFFFLASVSRSFLLSSSDVGPRASFFEERSPRASSGNDCFPLSVTSEIPVCSSASSSSSLWALHFLRLLLLSVLPATKKLPASS